MSIILISLQRLGSCLVVHQQSGAVITTDDPLEGGSECHSFSAVDLLAAALGTCVATSIDLVALRHYVPLQSIKIEVKNELVNTPKQLAKLSVSIQVEGDVAPEVSLRLRRAAENCAVRRSLHPDIAVQIDFVSRQRLE